MLVSIKIKIKAIMSTNPHTCARIRTQSFRTVSVSIITIIIAIILNLAHIVRHRRPQISDTKKRDIGELA